MPDIKPPFRFWSFFFSPQGRVSRRAIWFFVVPQKPVSLFLGGMLFYLLGTDTPPAITESSWRIAATTTGILYLLLTWSAFAVVSKRLHDVGLPAMLAAPPLISAAWYFATPIIRATGFYAVTDHYELISAAVNWINIYHVLLIGVFSFVPGQTADNRFGTAVTGSFGYATRHF